MKKRMLTIVLTTMLLLTACTRTAKQSNNTGNQSFANQDYDSALASYARAQDGLPDVRQPYYNAGNTYYRQEAFDPAAQELQQALSSSDTNLAQNGYYNLGNTFYQSGQYEPAIEAYKEALRLDPDDVDAKYNLELALQKQREREEAQEQEQQPQEEEQGEQQDQSQEGDQNQSGQEKPDQPPEGENQSQQPQEEEQGDQQAGQSTESEPAQEEQEGQPQQTRVQALTPEEARRLLEAAAEGTHSLQEFRQMTYTSPGPPPDKDW